MELHVIAGVLFGASWHVAGIMLRCLSDGVACVIVSGCSGGLVDVVGLLVVCDMSSRKNCRDRLMLRRICVRWADVMGLSRASSVSSLSLVDGSGKDRLCWRAHLLCLSS